MRGRVLVLVRTLACGVCAVVLLSSLGCSSKEKPPELHAVSGKVTFQGKPVPGAKVIFVPAAEDPKKPSRERAAGEADEEGKYELTWGVDQITGSPAGKFKVFIIAFEAVGDDHDTESKPPSLIPEKYSSPATSGLTATVKDEDDNVIDFELKP